ncbi:MAG TPA: hypothetical protein VHI13_02780 [Candidatus Kapabacteria bacterium]|nr:hypothetical protein [Candidatus Kapabacteria bacterium]
MNARRFVAPALAVVLLAGVAAAVWYSNRDVKSGRAAADSTAQAAGGTVHGLIGSEKEAFFSDPRVRKALGVHGLNAVVEKAGSRTIANSYDPKLYDFGFPSGAPAAAQLRVLSRARNVYTPFYTPIVLASWRPIAEILVANGIAVKQDDFYYVVDMARLITMIKDGTRWKDLKGSAAFQTGKAVLVNSTDVRTSNSAAMYLSLASYVANGQQVVGSQAEVEKVMPVVAPLFLRQGFQETSSAGPFEDYLALGMGKAPLLVAYESQMVEFWLKHPDRISSDMVLLYPRPTVYSKHVIVPYTPAGELLGAAMESDTALIALAHEYGFRTGGDVKGPEIWARKGIKVPAVLQDVVDPPSYEWLERMIKEIESRFN